MRSEFDSFGEILVPSSVYYGAQTARSIKNFPICSDNAGHRVPKDMVKALLFVKKACALANLDLMSKYPDSKEFAKFSKETGEAIVSAVDSILGNSSSEDQSRIRNINAIPQTQSTFDWFYETNFPLVTWQTGSGTQSNMNVNEVIASVANEKATGEKGGKSPVHPNDHCNLGQSSNDTFPTAMNVSTVLLAFEKLLPTLTRFSNEIGKKANEFSPIVKIGRTHTQDATPVTLGQEFDGYKSQIITAYGNILSALNNVHILAQGGTAVGTGLNSHPEFSQTFAKYITEITPYNALRASVQDPTLIRNEFFSHKTQGKFMAMATSDELVHFHGSLNTLAGSVMKIANDIRFLASGPRSGIGELILPANEPGSSIMPGKVNPTQCEALTMLACQVIGNNVAVTTGGMQGHFELNVFRPMIIRNVIESIHLLSDGINSFIDNCLVGIKVNHTRIKLLLEQSLMLITALNPYLGYDNCAKIAKYAYEKDITLKEACQDLDFFGTGEGKIDISQWDVIMDPSKMV